MTTFPIREPSLAALSDAPVNFRYGANRRRVPVDALTAQAILQVAGAVNAENRAKLDRMLGTPAGLSKVASFALSKCRIA